MRFRIFLPFDRFRLATSLPLNEVRRRLEGITAPKRNFGFSFSESRDKPYEGQVSGDKFEISRIIDYRNSFLPIIRGNFSTCIDKTEIIINMRPAIVVLIFMAIWMGTVGMVCLGMTTAAILHPGLLFKSRFSPAALIPFGMLLFGYALTTLSYRAESQRSKAFLAQFLEAEEVSS